MRHILNELYCFPASSKSIDYSQTVISVLHLRRQWLRLIVGSIIWTYCNGKQCVALSHWMRMSSWNVNHCAVVPRFKVSPLKELPATRNQFQSTVIVAFHTTRISRFFLHRFKECWAGTTFKKTLIIWACLWGQWFWQGLEKKLNSFLCKKSST